MPKICYKSKRFKDSSLSLIATADAILDEYKAQGFELTLRGLYYQFVARDLMPNTTKSYNRLGAIINDARLAGLIDWSSIVDTTRRIETNAHWSSPLSILRDCVDWYAVDRWDSQPCNVEVWIEKDALKGVISGVCRELDVPYFSCRGYVSQSEMWKASARRMSNNNHTLILHMGDHDPSGTDMTRDILDRLTMFDECDFDIKRIALNMDQVEEYDPPPNPAKLTDSRIGGYLSEYGDESWELDALEPSVMVDLIRSEVTSVIDYELWAEAEEKEDQGRRALRDYVDKFTG